MKHSNYQFILYLSGFVFISACENSEISQLRIPNDNQQIEYRDPDPNCDMCNDITQPHCCCVVQSVEPDGPINLHICGVLEPTNESCSMNTGLGCYNVGNLGIYTVLDQYESQYFCIATNASFSLYNANGSGNGRVRVGCSGVNEPQGSIGLNLDYTSGGYVRHFETEGCDVQLPCDY